MDACACVQTCRRLRSFWICLVIVLFSAPAFAIDHDLRIDQLHHTAWTARDGAPGGIQALAQTTDGFLWLGTTSGLYRFDGVQFEHYQPPAGPALQQNNVFALLAVPDGGLWIGFRQGGVSFLRNGIVTNYSEQDGIPSGTVTAFVRDRHEAVWMAAVGGLARREGSRWRQIGADWNFFGAAYTMCVDRQGALWVGTPDRILLLRDGTTRFQTVVDHLRFVRRIVQSPDDTLWMAETGRSVRPVPLQSKIGRERQGEIQVGSVAVLFDHQGSFWITSIGDGLRRVRYPERLQGLHIAQFSHAADIFTRKDGLTDDYVNCTLEDREGNIWVGTNLGLDRFRQTALTPIFFPSGTAQFRMAAGRGAIWALTSNHGLFQIQNQAIVGRRSLFGLFPINYNSPKTGTYFASAFWCFTHGRQRLIKVPKDETYAVTEDREKRLWISTRHEGVVHWENGRWVSIESLGGPKGPSRAEFVDGQGRLWLGYHDNTVAVLERDHVRSFSRQNGIAVGTVLAIGGRDSSLWIGGDHGLAFFDGSRFQSVTGRGGQAFSDIYGIVATADGLWFSENRGIIHIPAGEAQRVQQDPQYRVNWELFDSSNGLNAPPQRTGLRPSVIEGSDGVIWFATTQGLVWIDPKRRIPRNTLPPSVIIKSVVASNQSHASSEPIKLPVRTKDLQIAYTATSLSIPERVRFRYKLEGLDQAWQEAGARREAFYTNLGPGSYRFRVIACNNDGVWNEAGALMDLVIPPTIFQTDWFHASSIMLALGFLWLLYQLRLRHLRAELQLRLADRLSERERIARELHDTLLQSFQGLLFRFEAVRRLIPDRPQEALHAMDCALEKADQAVNESREAIQGLRSTAGRSDLVDALSALERELAASYARRPTPSLQVTVEGTPRILNAIFHDEVYRIAAESIRNAFQHARARRIEAEVGFGDRLFWVRVRDDGQGIGPDILKTRGRNGHFGLVGMYERAQRLGGHLEVWSETGAGTEIEFKISGSLAFGPIDGVPANRLGEHSDGP